MLKFNLEPMGDRLLVVMYSEPKKTDLILPEGSQGPQHLGPQHFFKVVGIGTGDFVQKNYKIDDFVLIRSGTPIPTFKLGKDMIDTGMVEAHTVLSKVDIIEGEIIPQMAGEMISREQIESLTKPKFHEPD